VIFEDQKDFIQALNASGAAYLVIGGHAVSIHAEPRATKDIDIWIGDDLGNRQKVIQALIDFGAPFLIIEGLEKAKPNEFLRMGTPPNCIDLLQLIPGADDFERSFENKHIIKIDNFYVNVIGIDDLILAKKASGRKQDLADVEALEKI